MYIYNIQCDYKEYRRLNNNKWELFVRSRVTVDSNFISSMVEAGKYLTNMGGTQEVSMKKNRRYGMQVSSVTCISFCNSIKKEYVFNYNNSKYTT